MTTAELGTGTGAGDAVARRGRDLAAMVGDLERLEQIFAGWDDHQRAAVVAYQRAIDELHAEALRRIVRALQAEPAAIAAMRGAVTDEVVYSVMRRLGLVKPSLDERVEVALERVRPMLAAHGGDVELVRVVPPRIEVRFLGACDGCASSALTFHAGVQQAVFEACPELTEVVQVAGTAAGHPGPAASPFAVTSLGAWRDACELGALADGGVHPVVLGSRRVVLARRGRAVTCFDNACPHLGLGLDDGDVAGGVLTCAHHGFQYDLATGACLTAPAIGLATHPARVVGTRVEVKLA